MYGNINYRVVPAMYVMKLYHVSDFQIIHIVRIVCKKFYDFPLEFIQL